MKTRIPGPLPILAALLLASMHALIVASPTSAVDSIWHLFGPGGGGWIEDVVAHPTNPQEVWAMTDLSGLFRSRDAGVTWRKMSADVERGVPARKQIISHKRQFAIDPQEPRLLYWGVCGMIWASHDGGVTWQAVFGVPPKVGDDKTPQLGHALACAADGTVYALDHESTLRVSRDHGATWTELTKPPRAKNSADTPAFPFLLADGTLCVACRPSRGLAISKDGGNTWEMNCRRASFSPHVPRRRAADCLRLIRPANCIAASTAAQVSR
ncbi:MAG: hypothetical protein K1X57_22295 [Gemmataceae bacterium]|nr:hypothetical protein [Gemmataceae bacterium]